MHILLDMVHSQHRSYQTHISIHHYPHIFHLIRSIRPTDRHLHIMQLLANPLQLVHQAYYHQDPHQDQSQPRTRFTTLCRQSHHRVNMLILVSHFEKTSRRGGKIAKTASIVKIGRRSSHPANDRRTRRPIMGIIAVPATSHQ